MVVAHSFLDKRWWIDWQNRERATPNVPVPTSLKNWAGNEEYEPWLNEWPNLNPAGMALGRGAPAEELVVDSGNAEKHTDWYNGW